MRLQSRLISSDVTRKQLETVFRKGKLKEGILWQGEHQEAHYFFTTLKRNKFIKINPVWQSVAENFIIPDKNGQPMESEQMRSMDTYNKKKSYDTTRIKEINSLIDILNGESS